jgi:hypothetical protein
MYYWEAASGYNMSVGRGINGEGAAAQKDADAFKVKVISMRNALSEVCEVYDISEQAVLRYTGVDTTVFAESGGVIDAELRTIYIGVFAALISMDGYIGEALLRWSIPRGKGWAN